MRNIEFMRRMRKKTGHGLALLLAALFLVSLPLSVNVSAAARLLKISSSNRVGKLVVVMGNSETVRLSMPFSEIVVGDPETADVNPLTDKTLYVLGRKLGTTNVTLFDENKQLVAVIDIEVTHNLGGLKQALQRCGAGRRSQRALDQWPGAARRPGAERSRRRKGHADRQGFRRRRRSPIR